MLQYLAYVDETRLRELLRVESDHGARRLHAGSRDARADDGDLAQGAAVERHCRICIGRRRGGRIAFLLRKGGWKAKAHAQYAQRQHTVDEASQAFARTLTVSHCSSPSNYAMRLADAAARK